MLTEDLMQHNRADWNWQLEATPGGNLLQRARRAKSVCDFGDDDDDDDEMNSLLNVVLPILAVRSCRFFLSQPLATYDCTYVYYN